MNIIRDRREVLAASAAVTVNAAVTQLGLTRSAAAQGQSPGLPTIQPETNTSFAPLKQVEAGVLNVGYAEAGPANGSPVILLHGWPYDIHSFVDVAPALASAGYRVIVPYIRGYGSTRFLSSETMRNGQPSAVAVDMIALMDALKIEKPILAGFDWGARTGDIIAAVWPERCKALVSVSDYLIGSQESGRMPLPPSAELQWWYQFYFATDRGRDGYDKYRHDFSKLIWRLASPKWNFDDATYDRSAAAFENPDHVSVVIHNYRWRLGLAEGEAKYDNMEKRLAESPAITVPTITLEGDANGAPHSEPSVCSGRISNDQLNELLLVRIIVKSGIRSSDYQFVDEGHAYECSACTHKRGQVTNDSPIGRFRTEPKRSDGSLASDALRLCQPRVSTLSSSRQTGISSNGSAPKGTQRYCTKQKTSYSALFRSRQTSISTVMLHLCRVERSLIEQNLTSWVPFSQTAMPKTL